MIKRCLLAFFMLALVFFEIRNAWVLGALVLLFAFGWCAVGVRLRGLYLDQFRAAISKNPVVPGGGLDLNAVEVLVEALSSDNPPTHASTWWSLLS